jgi:predicted DNA-binding protein (UPF0251 family)
LLAERKESIQKNPQRWLDKIHKTPAWFSAKRHKVTSMFTSKGVREYVKEGTKRTVKTRALTFTQFDQELRSKDPARTARAEKILVDYFNGAAGRAIQRYFRMRPKSPYSFNQLYQQMLISQWVPFLQSAKKLGLRQATGGLNIALSLGRNEKSIQDFERLFTRKRDSVGMFQVGTGKYDAVDTRQHANWYTEHEIRSPFEMDRFPAPAVSNTEFENILSTPSLSPIERELLRKRFMHDMTLEELGKDMGMTREGVRIREVKALRKIRAQMNVPMLPQRRIELDLKVERKSEVDAFLKGRKVVTASELGKWYASMFRLPKINPKIAGRTTAQLVASGRLKKVRLGIYHVLPPE